MSSHMQLQVSMHSQTGRQLMHKTSYCTPSDSYVPIIPGQGDPYHINLQYHNIYFILYHLLKAEYDALMTHTFLHYVTIHFTTT